MRTLPRAATVTAALSAGVLVATCAASSVAAAPDFDMPFRCGQSWEGSTRATHSPSSLAVDWNRDQYDEGQPVTASVAGVVTSVVDLGDRSYGLYVVVDHGGGWTTLHAHLSRAFVVEGQRVDQGQTIALVGNSGGSSGAHLHYEQRLDRSDRHAVFHGSRFRYNSWLASRNCVDVPVTGDWNGDQRTDVGVFARNRRAVFRKRFPSNTRTARVFGSPTDMPVLGDWDGDGQTEAGTWSQSTRIFRRDLPGSKGIRFGQSDHLPVSGDWNGDGRWDVGTWEPSTGTFALRGPRGSYSTKVLGDTSDLPVTGDWDGNGRWDVGVYDPATARFTLRLPDASTKTITYGAPGRLPVIGFWNGDAVSDVGVWDPTRGVFSKRVRPRKTVQITFGRIR